MRLVPEVSSAVTSIETGIPSLIRESPYHAAIGFACGKGPFGSVDVLDVYQLVLDGAAISSESNVACIQGYFCTSCDFQLAL